MNSLPVELADGTTRVFQDRGTKNIQFCKNKYKQNVLEYVFDFPKFL